MNIWNLDDDDCTDISSAGIQVIDLNTDSVIDVFIPGPPGPPGSGAGQLLETLTTDTEVTPLFPTQFIVVWAEQAITINLPLASTMVIVLDGKNYSLPLTIKNETGVAITLNPSGDDTSEITLVEYQNQSVTLLPRTGGYSAI